MPSTNHYLTFGFNALIMCDDTHYVHTLERVFLKLGVRSEPMPSYDLALATLLQRRVDAVVMDWQQISNLREFLESLSHSKMSKQCVLIGIASDLSDLHHAFSAGLQFMIHKPASALQIERCLRAAYGEIIHKRRKQHREPVRIAATLQTRNLPLLGGMITNLGAYGAGLKLNVAGCRNSASLKPGDDIDLSFISPGSGTKVHGSGEVVWANGQGDAGVRFQYLAAGEKKQLEQWVRERFDNGVADILKNARGLGKGPLASFLPDPYVIKNS